MGAVLFCVGVFWLIGFMCVCLFSGEARGGCWRRRWRPAGFEELRLSEMQLEYVLPDGRPFICAGAVRSLLGTCPDRLAAVAGAGRIYGPGWIQLALPEGYRQCRGFYGEALVLSPDASDLLRTDTVSVYPALRDWMRKFGYEGYVSVKLFPDVSPVRGMGVENAG